ncbi:MAG: dihydrodipicolinate synthase family protein [Actinobacteria bacterium]|nr:dihydrodipicolinate synthase family protein [Actinomycetota bacterium]
MSEQIDALRASKVWPAGLLTPMLTPLSGGELDLKAFGQMLELQVRAGAAGVVVGGGSGEFGTLTVAERHRLAAESVAILAGRLPTVVQTGALATRDAIELSIAAEKTGAAGLLLASPFGEAINWRERYRFYEEVDASVSLPIMIYNTPPSGLLSMVEVEELAGLSNVNAIKDSSGDFTFLGDLLVWAGANDVAVYIGWDNLVKFAAESGARGAIVGVANLIGEEIARTLELAAAGEPVEAWPTLREFIRVAESSANYVALCKACMIEHGIDAGQVRAPYLMPSAAEVEELRGHFRAVREAFADGSSEAQEAVG